SSRDWLEQVGRRLQERTLIDSRYSSYSRVADGLRTTLRRDYAEPTFILLRESYCFSFFVDRQVFLREVDQRVTILENWPSIKLATRRFTHHAIRLVDEAHRLPFDTRNFEFCYWCV